jgi:hypothetical protein
MKSVCMHPFMNKDNGKSKPGRANASSTGTERLSFYQAPNENPTASSCVGSTTVKFFCHELYVHSMAAVPCRHQDQGRGPAKHAESLESAAVKSDFSVAAVVAPGGRSASASASV